jgi:hypothetical protein
MSADESKDSLILKQVKTLLIEIFTGQIRWHIGDFQTAFGLSDTRNNVGKTVSAGPLALSAIWSIFGWLLKFGLGDGGLATRERLHYGRY